MAFELAEAYVQLSSQGFDFVLGGVDSLEYSLKNLQSTAGVSTTAVDQMVPALTGIASNFLEGAGAAGSFADASRDVDSIVSRILAQLGAMKSSDLGFDADKLESSIEALRAVEQIAGDLGETELGILKQIEEAIPLLVENRKEVLRIHEAFVAYDKSIEPPIKSIEQLNAEIEKAGESAKNTGAAIDEFIKGTVEGIETDLDKQFDQATQSAEKLEQQADKIEVDRLEASLKRADAAGAALISTLSGMTVYLLQASRVDILSAQVKQAEKLRQKIQEVNATAHEGRRNSVTGTYTNQIKELEHLLSLAKADEISKENAKKTAYENASNAGAFIEGTGDDPRVMRKYADGQLKAAQSEVAAYEEKLKEVKTTGADAFTASTEELKKQKLQLEGNVEAIERMELAKRGLDEGQINQLIDESNLIRSEVEAKKLSESFEQQMQTLRLRNIELKEGAEAAARERDIIAGFGPIERVSLAIMREEAALQEKANEAKRAGEVEAQRALAAEKAQANAFKSQVDQLRLRKIELEQGAEAAAKMRDKMNGLSEDERERLAELRKDIAALEAANGDQGAEETATSSNAFGTVGVAELAGQMQSAVNGPDPVQREIADNTKAIAEQGREQMAMKTRPRAPRVDSSFGAGNGSMKS